MPRLLNAPALAHGTWSSIARAVVGAEVPLPALQLPSGGAVKARFPYGSDSNRRHYQAIAVVTAWVVLGLGLFATPSADAQTLTTLYSFCAQGFACTDGFWPQAGLVQGSDGSLYGTTSCGGTNPAFGATCNGGGGGTIFKISPGGALTTLYNFCVQEQCMDGQVPEAALILGSDGNFYGTTAAGGAGLGGCFLGNGCGTVFKVTPDGALTTLYSFCSVSDCVDGATPLGSLVQASDGNLYSTTASGGANGQGTVFKMTPGGALTTLYSFCAGSGCTSGQYPYAGLVQGNDGNFYGTTHTSSTDAGTIFRITSSGALSTLYTFCLVTSCTDGKSPLATLVQGQDSDFYGTTAEGGANATVTGTILGGTIFKTTPQGALTTLYSFCSQSSCTDGQYPVAGLIQATDGYFYGTTQWGGAYVSGPEGSAAQTGGTVFRIAAGGALSTLYSFCAQSSCTDGEFPMAGLVLAGDGNIYGTTQGGGANGGGTVFKLSPPGGVPFVSLSPTSLTFPPEYVGVASSSQSVTLANTGNVALSITSITVFGDFSQTNTCGTGLAAGANCVISVTFTPTAAGTRDGGVSIADDASLTGQTVVLSGTGQDFAAGAASGSSTSQTVKAGQTAAYNLAFTPLGASGTLALSCAGAPTGATCTVNPASLILSGTGAASATVTVTTTAKTEGQPLGKRDHPAGSRRPVHYPWSPILIGWLLIVILTAVSAAAKSLRPHSNRTCSARKPESAGAGIAARTAWADQAAGVKTLAPTLLLLAVATWVACGGGGNSTSPPPPVPGVSLSASNLTFSAQNMGSTSSAQAVTLTNSGNADLMITSIVLGGTNSGDFSQSNTCGGGVAAGANCQISVKFSPTATGTRAASVTITDNAPGSPQAISLSGTGVTQATPPGTYTLTVSATLTSSLGTLTHTVPLWLTVN